MLFALFEKSQTASLRYFKEIISRELNKTRSSMHVEEFDKPIFREFFINNKVAMAILKITNILNSLRDSCCLLAK